MLSKCDGDQWGWMSTSFASNSRVNSHRQLTLLSPDRSEAGVAHPAVGPPEGRRRRQFSRQKRKYSPENTCECKLFRLFQPHIICPTNFQVSCCKMTGNGWLFSLVVCGLASAVLMFCSCVAVHAVCEKTKFSCAMVRRVTWGRFSIFRSRSRFRIEKREQWNATSISETSRKSRFGIGHPISMSNTGTSSFYSPTCRIFEPVLFVIRTDFNDSGDVKTTKQLKNDTRHLLHVVIIFLTLQRKC